MKILILDGATFGEDIDISKFNELGEVIVYAAATGTTNNIDTNTVNNTVFKNFFILILLSA